MQAVTMEPSAKLLDDIKAKGNTLRTQTLGRFQLAAQKAKNFVLGPPPPPPQQLRRRRRQQREDYVKPVVPVTVYESKEYDEIYDGAKPQSTPPPPEPEPEPVYSDLNLPELIDDVRRLREEIRGARVDLRNQKRTDQWRLVELFMRLTVLIVILSFVLVCARSDDKIMF